MKIVTTTCKGTTMALIKNQKWYLSFFIIVSFVFEGAMAALIAFLVGVITFHPFSVDTWFVVWAIIICIKFIR